MIVLVQCRWQNDNYGSDNVTNAATAARGRRVSGPSQLDRIQGQGMGLMMMVVEAARCGQQAHLRAADTDNRHKTSTASTAAAERTLDEGTKIR